jgi:cell division protein FtsI (penicillin-binding protein 3)
MQTSTSDIMRKLMRLVVTDGFGKSAEVAGYYPGGKTGTAEKVAAHGGYKKHANVAAFMSVFPMNEPRYAVYMMLDEPHGNKKTYGYATAGWVVAPSAGKVIARIGPMLGLLPDIIDMPQINQALAIPLQPSRPAGTPPHAPAMVSAPTHAPVPATTTAQTTAPATVPAATAVPATTPVDASVKATAGQTHPNLTVPATILPPAISHPTPDIRRQTNTLVPATADAPLLAASTVTPVVAR